MNDLTPFQYQYFGQEVIATHKSVGVHLHLFYGDLWEWFLPYIQNISYDFDLFVTITETQLNHSVADRVYAHYPKATIIHVPNKGLDVGPFLFVLNEIAQLNKSYDCILKLHSKKSLAHGESLGNPWRKALADALLKDQTTFEIAFNNCIKHPTYKMAGSKNWVLKQEWVGYEAKYFTNLRPLESYFFVGGTMFLINFKLLMDWFTSQRIFARFYDDMPEGYVGDGSTAHELERVFGLLVYATGNTIFES